MKILYVILTCDAYVPTRCQWQRDTWISLAKNFVFLGCRDRPEISMVGWNTEDNYDSCPLKILEFMRNYSYEEYDWVVFADDDTFIFPQRLESYLETLDAHRPVYVGITCNDGWTYMSGGAGFAVSRELGVRIQTYVRSKPTSELHTSRYSDKTFGSWVHNVHGEFVENNHFRADYRPEYIEQPIFTCHYVKQEGFYALAPYLSK